MRPGYASVTRQAYAESIRLQQYSLLPTTTCGIRLLPAGAWALPDVTARCCRAGYGSSGRRPSRCCRHSRHKLELVKVGPESLPPARWPSRPALARPNGKAAWAPWRCALGSLRTGLCCASASCTHDHRCAVQRGRDTGNGQSCGQWPVGVCGRGKGPFVGTTKYFVVQYR